VITHPHLAPRLGRVELAIPLLPLWAFVACSRVNITFTFTFTRLVITSNSENKFDLGIGRRSHTSGQTLLEGDTRPAKPTFVAFHWSKFVVCSVYNLPIKLMHISNLHDTTDNNSIYSHAQDTVYF
jgi:hypothetical protein